VILRDELAWFERRPLFGKRIVVTRPEPNTALSLRLRELGADVIEMPATRIEPLDLQPLYRGLLALKEYQWVVFTSRHAVRIVWEVLRAAKKDARAFASVKIVAVGPATADELLKHGLAVDVVPERYSSEGVLDALLERDDVRGARVLYPVAEGARDVLAQGLREIGAQVEPLTIYRSQVVAEGADPLKEALRSGSVDYVTFTAGSTVRGFIDAVGPELATRSPAATIGPITSAAAREAGLDVHIEAAPATTEGLVDALLAALSS
jgi:uroporphyrinogen III methyltransferase/synthase